MKHKGAKATMAKTLKNNLSGSTHFDEAPKSSHEMQDKLQCALQVASFVQMYESEEPQIGTVTAPVENQYVEIEWMVGSYSEPWTLCARREGGSYVPWKELIRHNSLLFPVELTRSYRLSPALVKKLKDAYKKIRETVIIY